MTDKEIQASDEEMEKFNVLQNEKCVSADEEKKDLNCEEEIKDLKIQCEYCKTHCGEIFHFNLAKLNFNLEKKISELKKENEDLKKNALVWHDYEIEKPQKEGECILIIEKELCGQKRQIKCLHYAEETNMGFDFITNHKILKWAELPEV